MHAADSFSEADVTALAVYLAGGRNPRREGGQLRTTCPLCHHDNLVLRRTSGGGLLVHCWNSCPQGETYAAVMAAAREIGIVRDRPPRAHNPGTLATRPASHARQPAQPARPSQSAQPAGQVDGARWWESYTGVPWERWQEWGCEAVPGGVAFIWPSLPGVRKIRRRDGPKGLWSGSPTPPVWPEVPEQLAEEVWLTEGESDCGVLRHAGLPAFAVTKGASGALTPDLMVQLRLRGARRLVVCTDADRDGRRAAAQNAGAALAAGLEALVVRWDGLLRPELGEKDARDLSRRLGDPARLREALSAAAVPWRPGEGEGEEEEPAAGAVLETVVVPEDEEVPWPTMAEEAFYGLVGECARLLAEGTEADPAGVLACLLVALSAYLGAGPYLPVGDHHHGVRLWAVLVGETARGRKGLAWGLVRRFLELVDAGFVREKVESGLSSGEGLIWAVRDAIVRYERVRDPLTKERVTQEAVVDPGVADKRLLVVEDELTSSLKVMAREGNTLSPVLRRAWDHGNLGSLTKNSPAKATGAHICVLGHITPAELRRYLTETEVAGGFANRFLWVCVRRQGIVPRPAPTDPHLLDEMAAAARERLERAAQVGQVGWTPAAAKLWDRVYLELSEHKPGLWGEVVARNEAQALRLAGLYALLDGRSAIDVPHLAAALAVIDYCEQSACWIWGDTLGDPVADEVLKALRRQGELTRTDVHNLFGRNVPVGRITASLRELARRGLAHAVIRHVEGERGRPAEVWLPGPASKDAATAS